MPGAFVTSVKKSRKPPPDLASAEESTSVPFSADTFGLDDDDEPMPTKVFHLGQQVKSLTFTASDGSHQMNSNEIDPQYYAPTPSEHFAKSSVLTSTNLRPQDVKVDLNTDSSGYLGEGTWRVDKGKFSPSVFQRINDENCGMENKPAVPPKIPSGLTEMEYYVLEKDSYLKDINGRRL